MTLRMTHELGRHVELRRDGRPLYRYVYRPDTPPVESSRPYFHPLRTLAGDVVTIFRPHDHLWHHGLSMTVANLSGENFWGGPTFVRDEGYRQLPNNGRQEHEGWDEMTAERLVERLRWTTEGGETWFRERREVRLAGVDDGEGWWALELAFALENVSGRELAFGSPTTAGRPDAGYGGLFWRGPREFVHGGAILGAGGLEGPGAMGGRASWLAYTGRHDGTANASTVAMLDAPANPRHPTRWFVRDTPYACLSAAFSFDTELPLPPGETLALRHAVVVAAGALSRDGLDAIARRLGFAA